jgi:8-oxo-dGTP pyrophosphatase MutT (NUDIX family)
MRHFAEIVEASPSSMYHAAMSTHRTTRVLSCGILIESPLGWLLAHATRTARWDIPKGKIEEGESPIEAALRETREEIGLDLEWARDRMIDMGRHGYLPRKDLHLFHLKIEQPLDIAECRCSTLITLADGEQFPETDDFRWVAIDKAHQWMGKGLTRYLVGLDLMPDPVGPEGPAGQPWRRPTHGG